MICKKDFLKLQKLARLYIKPEEEDCFLNRFDKSLSEISRINDIDGKIYDSIKNFAQGGSYQILSEDVAQEVIQQDVISNAPNIEQHLEQQYFSVPKVIK